jgi:hypothetical protein
MRMVELPKAFFLAALLLAACGGHGGSSQAGKIDAGSGTCGAAQPCGDGFVCLRGECVEGEALHVVVDPKARGCQAALRDASDAVLLGASFGAEVQGSFVHRAPKLGLSFIAGQDSAIEPEQVDVLVSGGGTPKVEKSSCVDASGKELEHAAFDLISSSK